MLAHQVGHLFDHLVAGLVAVGVVDALEVVDVEHHQAGRVAMALVARIGNLQALRRSSDLQCPRLYSPVSRSVLESFCNCALTACNWLRLVATSVTS